MDPKDYRSYRDLPPIAGIGSFEDAMKIGLPIDASVARLKRQHWAFRRLHEILIKRLTAEPIYELKMAWSLHAYYCAEHAAAWRKRVGEMREPPLGLDAPPHPALDAFFDEILAAPDTAALIVGVYEKCLPALRDALRHYVSEVNRLVDHPSFRLCRFALIEVEEMMLYGEQAAVSLVDRDARSGLAPWIELLDRLFARARGFEGPGEPGTTSLERMHSATPHQYDPVPQRDERFPDPYNMGVHAEVFLYDEKMPAEAKPLMMYYKRLREIDVPEMMASIIAQTPNKPWGYTLDMTRQLWDEARHAMMGEIGFIRAGIDWRRYVRVNSTWSRALNTQLTPDERHAVLYFIEQGLMQKTGKRFEWEVGLASGDPFSAMIQDFDWADEVLHARIGREWYVNTVGSQREAIEYGDKCWSRVLIDWQSYIDRGLTKHENWWPALYHEWCRVHGRTPDRVVAGFNSSYATVRADLREVASSG